MPALTIGMATYNDFDGVYFTLQALRLYHDLEDTELIVIDNFGSEPTEKVANAVKARYILATEIGGTAAPRDRLFREATGDAVLCVDSHILFVPGAIAKLKQYYRDNPGTNDLLQGPLLYDDGKSISTHFEPTWRSQMWGTWGTDPRGKDPDAEPFEIPMQGLGVFSSRREAWLGFNPHFRGFGGEEGYIHEKYRQAGARALCLPFFRWMHRFGRPAGVPYRLTVEDKLRNYIIGHSELGLDLMPILTHFAEHLPQDRVISVAARALEETAGASLAVAPTGQSLSPETVGQRARSGAVAAHGSQPLVSCICMTYNRPPHKQYLLEEAIEAFLRQDYPNKELIVINDAPTQELVCNAPGVRIINHPIRFASLGEKTNFAVTQSRGDLIAPWDDDDISLPWRLTRSVELMGDADYFNPRHYWFLDSKGLHGDHNMGVGHNCSLIRRTAWDALGGYAKISFGYDQEFDGRILTSKRPVVDARGKDALPRDDWFYIYRWGVSPNHVSGAGREGYYSEIGKHPVVSGRFTLKPHWRSEYDDDVLAYDGPPHR